MNKYDNSNAETGSRIKEIRLKRNMTQETLSEKANICNPQQMSNIERGLSGLSIARFKDICKVLDIEADYLLFGNSVKTSETAIHKYIEKMNDSQISDLIKLVEIYAKACGIEVK